LKQRRGRAGRVRPGSCYKLISRETLSKLPQHGEPEIKRCALDQTLLSLLFLGVEQGSGNFLSKMIDPPSQIAIDAATFSLEKIGAVVVSNSREERRLTLTPLGLHLAGIPAPPVIGKSKFDRCLHLLDRFILLLIQNRAVLLFFSAGNGCSFGMPICRSSCCCRLEYGKEPLSAN